MNNSEVKKLVSRQQTATEKVAITLSEKLKAEHWATYSKYGWNHGDRCVCKLNKWKAPEEVISIDDF